jgi:hypothetical protein
MVLHRWWELLALVVVLVLIGHALRPVSIVFTHTPTRDVELPQLTEQDQLVVEHPVDIAHQQELQVIIFQT